MRYGLFQNISTESKSVVPKEVVSEPQVSDDVYLDALESAQEIALESEADYLEMRKATAVADHLESRRDIISAAMEQPDTITVDTAMLARESMHMARELLLMGPTEYTVSNEALSDMPLDAMRVTHEGIGSTLSKIYDGVKNAFEKISLAIKKLTAKLIVLMDRTGKEAESLLKSFKADKMTHPSQLKLKEADANKILDRLGGYWELSGGAHEDSIFGDMVDNIQNIRKMDSRIIEEYNKLMDMVFKDKDSSKILSSIPTFIKWYNGISRALKGLFGIAGREGAKPEDVTPEKIISSIVGSSKLVYDLKSRKDDFSISDDYVEDSLIFWPTFVKGNRIHGVAFYSKVVDDSEVGETLALLKSFKYVNISIPGLDDNSIESMSGNMKVMSRSDIMSGLSELKGSTHKLKSFSDARMRDINTAMQDISKLAKKKSGSSFLNSLTSTYTNRSRMFIAGNYVGSVFAMAAYYRSRLARLKIHLSYYEELL